MLTSAAVPLAQVTRAGVVESAHHGVAVALDAAGAVHAGLGGHDATIFARSSLKPLQAVAMVRAGLALDGETLALACASHSGESFHLGGVRQILRGAGLSEADLRNTPDLPLGVAASQAWRAAGHRASSLAQNCSGKHAAMLATCVAAGWPTEGYLEPTHPLQVQVRAVVVELTGDDAAHETVDGCGAPLFSCTVVGLARAFARVATGATGTAERRVAEAMSTHPAFVGGSGRDVTTVMTGLAGAVAKDGAEGVYAVGLPDGRAVALKVLDGSERARPVVLAEGLRLLGVEAAVLAELADVPVLGHGRRVGAVEALPWDLGPGRSVGVQG